MRNDFDGSVRIPAVAIKFRREGDLALRGCFVLAPADVCAEVFGFSLRLTAENRDQKFAACFHAVDALFLEIYINTDLFERPYVFDAV